MCCGGIISSNARSRYGGNKKSCRIFPAARCCELQQLLWRRWLRQIEANRSQTDCFITRRRSAFYCRPGIAVDVFKLQAILQGAEVAFPQAIPETARGVPQVLVLCTASCAAAGNHFYVAVAVVDQEGAVTGSSRFAVLQDGVALRVDVLIAAIDIDVELGIGVDFKPSQRVDGGQRNDLTLWIYRHVRQIGGAVAADAFTSQTFEDDVDLLGLNRKNGRPSKAATGGNVGGAGYVFRGSNAITEHAYQALDFEVSPTRLERQFADEVRGQIGGQAVGARRSNDAGRNAVQRDRNRSSEGYGAARGRKCVAAVIEAHQVGRSVAGGK